MLMVLNGYSNSHHSYSHHHTSNSHSNRSHGASSACWLWVLLLHHTKTGAHPPSHTSTVPAAAVAGVATVPAAYAAVVLAAVAPVLAVVPSCCAS